MSFKSLVMIGMVTGSIIGSYVPVLFGAGLFSYASVIGGGVGGVLGIYVAYKISSF